LRSGAETPQWRKNALSQIEMAAETLRAEGDASGAEYFEEKLPEARAIVARLLGGEPMHEL